MPISVLYKPTTIILQFLFMTQLLFNFLNLLLKFILQKCLKLNLDKHFKKLSEEACLDRGLIAMPLSKQPSFINDAVLLTLADPHHSEAVSS